MISVVHAIDSLEIAVKGNESREVVNGLYFTPSAAPELRYCLVGSALSGLGVTDLELSAMGPLSIDYLYESDKLPLPMSLGAMLVYRAAQRTQDGRIGTDRSWGSAFDNAVSAAARLIDLFPDSLVAAASAELVTNV